MLHDDIYSYCLYSMCLGLWLAIGYIFYCVSVPSLSLHLRLSRQHINNK